MTSISPIISLVVPVYKAGNILNELNYKIHQNLSEMNIPWELIYIEDGGNDNSWNIIENICHNNHHIKGVKLSRNFGQHYAITAGLKCAIGEWLVILDCDLQDNPKEIKRLYEKAKMDFDIVLCKRNNRQHNIVKTTFSKIYYKTLSYFTNSFHDSSYSNFGIYHKNVTDAFCSMGDSSRNFVTMTKWLGFKVGSIDVEHDKRLDGKSTYSIKKLLVLAADTILYFSNKPLYISIIFGLIISLISLSLGFFSLIKSYTSGVNISEYKILFISIWFLSGVILFGIGILGLYIGKIFDKVKDRPFYVVQKSINFNEDSINRIK